MSDEFLEKDKGEMQMQLLEIPEVLFFEEGGLFLKYLSLEELHQFRMVCKTTKRITDDFIRIRAEFSPEIEVDFGNKSKTFAAFIENGIRTEKLFLNNPSGYRFYENEEESTMRRFLKDFGPSVKHLRVKNLTLFPSGRELSFIQGLKNLKTFEAEKFVFGPDHDTPAKAEDLANRVMVPEDWHLLSTAFPPIFKNLEGIRIGQDPEDETMNKIKVTAEILMLCQKLKKASLPFTWNPVLPRPFGDNRGILMGEFNFLDLYTEPRPSDVYSEPGILEEFDFENYHDNFGAWDGYRTQHEILMYWAASLRFLQLLQKAMTTGLKMSNVSPFWFYARHAVELEANFQQTLASPQLGIPVKSLMGLHPCVMTLDMPNLERITIPYTSSCVIWADPNWRRPEWPALKYLDITVDDRFGCCWNFCGLKRFAHIMGYDIQPTMDLYNFLWKGVVRINLTELELKFVEMRWLGDKHVVPDTELIGPSCPNLKKIKLGGWPGTNSELSKLWPGLSGVEEVTLENCLKMGNVAFVGENAQDPTFLKMKNLKRLTLIGLDGMPKITDYLFISILRKMKIRTLVLTAKKPLKKITKKGINALLDGPFIESILKFPFKDWSLAGVSAEEFEKLRKKFVPVEGSVAD